MGRTPFCKKLIDKRPDFIGKTVWFCPNSAQKLECVINGDGTISPKYFIESKFCGAADLVKAVLDGSVKGDAFKIPANSKPSSYSFTTHLFFSSDSSMRVSDYLTTTAPLKYHETQKQSVCPGFSMDREIIEKLQSSSFVVRFRFFPREVASYSDILFSSDVQQRGNPQSILQSIKEIVCSSM
jgi:hypothetical protein